VPLSVTPSGNGTWVPAKTAKVMVGDSWVPVKKMKVRVGTSWVLSWVHPVVNASLSLSKTDVETGEAYNVTLTAPAGFPEGAEVVLRFTGYSQSFFPTEGSTSSTLVGASHASAGTYTWYADVKTKGGTTTFGPAVQTATVPVPPPPTHHHEVVPSGSSRAAIQAAMDRAETFFLANQGGTVNFDDENSMACVELVAGGTYNLDGTALNPRRGVRLIGGGSGASRPLLKASSAGHLFNNNNNGGGAYNNPHYDWLVQNIRMDCNNYVGGFSIVHTRRFRIKGCEFSNLGAVKHYIEINSSGGARSDGKYNVEVLDCYFTMTNTNPGNGARRTEDECCQLDYSWAGSASNTANDGTMSNNVKFAGNTFYRVPRAIGGHRYEAESGNGSPKGIHSNVLIDNNTFTEVNPVLYGDGANSANSEGAVRAYMWSNVRITNNAFNSCYQCVKGFIPVDAVTYNGEPTYMYVGGNTLNNCTSGRPGITYSTNSSLKPEQVHVENNIVEGTWSGSPFVVDIEENGTETLPGSTFGVVIRWNMFRPGNLSLAEEKAYNKYSRNGDASVYVYENYVSDGSVDNS